MNSLKKSDTQEPRLKIETNFASSNDIDEQHVMHSKIDNIKIMINDKSDEVSEKLFQSLLSKS